MFKAPRIVVGQSILIQINIVKIRLFDVPAIRFLRVFSYFYLKTNMNLAKHMDTINDIAAFFRAHRMEDACLVVPTHSVGIQVRERLRRDDADAQLSLIHI